MPPKNAKRGKNRAMYGRKKTKLRQWEDLHILLRIYCFLDSAGVTDVQLPHWVSATKKGIVRFLLFTTVVSSMNIIIESLPTFAHLRNSTDSAFFAIELICVLIYTIDWGVRLLTTPLKKEFLMNPLNIMDFVGLIPFWLAMGGVIEPGISKWILMIRVSRLVHFLLSWRSYDIVVTTIEESTEVAMLMMLVLAITLPIGGLSIYYAEKGTYNNATGNYERACSPWEDCTTETTPFRSGEDGVWFFMSVFTTLGWGDLYPKSDLGKVVASCSMGVGVFVLSFPIMILAVNFKEEIANKEAKLDSIRARDGQKLLELQKEHSARIDLDEEELAKKQEESMFGASGIDLGGGEPENTDKLPRPAFFIANDDGVPRRLYEFGKDEIRYNPLFFLQRKRDGSVHIEPTEKSMCEVSLSLVLDSKRAQREALQGANAALDAGQPQFKRARHFQVFNLHMHIARPPTETRCELLRDLRLTRTILEDISPAAYSIPIRLELAGHRGNLDEQKQLDFVYALHRCRLQLTAALVTEPPKEYEVPIYFDLLKSTNLYLELKGHKHRIVYLTEQQIRFHIEGIHHLLDLGRDDGEIITNPDEIAKDVTSQVLATCCAPCDDPGEVLEDAFLYSDLSETSQYYAVFVGRLEGKSSEDEETVLTMEEAERAAESKDRRILTTVMVKTVDPMYESFTIAL